MAFSDILNSLFNLGSSPEAAPSAQLRTSSGASGSWGTPVVTPQVVNPVIPTNTSTPQTSAPALVNNNGRDPHINPATGAWDDNYYQSQQQQSAPSIDWNAIYGPQLAALDQAAGTAQQSADLQNQNIQTQAASQKREIEDRTTEANQAFQTTEGKAKSNQESALSDAIRAYLALKQQSISRFGQGSSAGGAVNEIAQQQFYREQGKTQQSYADVFNTIQTQWNSTLRELSRASMKVDDWVSEQMNNTRTWLGNQLQQISMAKAQTESDKNAQKMQVLDRAREAAQAISSYKQQAMIQLDQWKQQQQFLLENHLAPMYGNQPSASGYTPQSLSLNSSNTSGALPAIRWNPRTARWEDELGNVVSS